MTCGSNLYARIYSLRLQNQTALPYSTSSVAISIRIIKNPDNSNLRMAISMERLEGLEKDEGKEHNI